MSMQIMKMKEEEMVTNQHAIREANNRTFKAMIRIILMLIWSK